MKPSDTRALLLDQHDEIRRRLATAEELAVLTRTGAPVVAELDAALLALTRALLEHNRSEESLLAPMLGVTGDGHSTQRIIRMHEEHLREHELMRAALGRDRATVAAEMGEIGEMLRAHMDAEERTFLHAAVLRDPSPN